MIASEDWEDTEALSRETKCSELCEECGLQVCIHLSGCIAEIHAYQCMYAFYLKNLQEHNN